MPTEKLPLTDWPVVRWSCWISKQAGQDTEWKPRAGFLCGLQFLTWLPLNDGCNLNAKENLSSLSVCHNRKPTRTKPIREQRLPQRLTEFVGLCEKHNDLGRPRLLLVHLPLVCVCGSGAGVCVWRG